MHVRIDEPRDHRLAGGVDDAECGRFSRGRPVAGGGFDEGDEGAAHHDRRARRDAAVAVNDAGVADEQICGSLGHDDRARGQGQCRDRSEEPHAQACPFVLRLYREVVLEPHLLDQFALGLAPVRVALLVLQDLPQHVGGSVVAGSLTRGD